MWVPTLVLISIYSPRHKLVIYYLYAFQHLKLKSNDNIIFHRAQKTISVLCDQSMSHSQGFLKNWCYTF